MRSCPVAVCVTLAFAVGPLAGLACKKSAPSDAQPAASAAPSASADTSDGGPDAFTRNIAAEFGKKYSCPDDRVSVKERPDLDPVKTLAPDRDFSLGTPPDEVRADPGRYAKWKADREADVASARQRYSQDRMFEVSGCGHTDLEGCHAHKGAGRQGGTAYYPDWPDCDPAPAPPQPVPSLATLATAQLQSWTPIDAPPVTGTYASFDIDANLDWATNIATAWSPDAKLFRLATTRLANDGTADLSPAGVATVTYYFNSKSKGDADLAIEVNPVRDRRRDGGAAGATEVEATPHRDTTGRAALPRPACTLARAAAAIKPRLAHAAGVFSVDLLLGGGKEAWHFVTVAGAGSPSVAVDVDAATCKVETR